MGTGSTLDGEASPDLRSGVPFIDTEAAVRYIALSPHSLECYRSLGRVDGFEQDEAASESDEACVILSGLLAADCDAFEALELAEGLLDAGAAAPFT